MRPRWEDLNARARGLSGRLLSHHQLEALARAPDLATLSAELRSVRIATSAEAESPDAGALEREIRRWAAGLLRILARWAGPRTEALPLVFEGEERRSLGALFRGAVQRAPAERRLAGLIPTPGLPERALDALAAAPTPAAAAALLSAWGHPWAADVAPLATSPTPDLVALETALGRAAARTAVGAARRSRDHELRRLVRDEIDLDNAATALVLSAAGRDLVLTEHYVPGGDRLPLEVFREAAAAAGPAAAGRRIGATFAGTPFAAPFTRRAADPLALGEEILRLRLRILTHRVRLAPLGVVPVVWIALRLRAQVLDLQRILWTVALGAPRTTLSGSLLSAAA